MYAFWLSWFWMASYFASNSSEMSTYVSGRLFTPNVGSHVKTETCLSQGFSVACWLMPGSDSTIARTRCDVIQ